MLTFDPSALARLFPKAVPRAFGEVPRIIVVIIDTVITKGCEYAAGRSMQGDGGPVTVDPPARGRVPRD